MELADRIVEELNDELVCQVRRPGVVQAWYGSWLPVQVTLMEFHLPSELFLLAVFPAPLAHWPWMLVPGPPTYQATTALVRLFAHSAHKDERRQVKLIHKFCSAACHASYIQERIT